MSTASDQMCFETSKSGAQRRYRIGANKRVRIQGDTTVDTTQYIYNYQGQLQVVSKNNQTIATYGYDHAGERIYSKDNQANTEKWAYWDQGGQIIGEGEKDLTDYTVRYIYSGNQKIAMERYNTATRGYQFYYFINNAQGTPVLITDEQGNAISRINLDDWGNVGDKTIADRLEINFTGKRMDRETGLYYFNQRYYDPELGRFLTEDPAHQANNPYLYCGNNPLMYTDPDGQFFGFDDALIIGLITSALQAGAWSAVISAGTQYVTTGQVNWNAVGSAFTSAALGSVVGGMTGVNFGKGFFNEMATAAVDRGLGNIANGELQGQNMSLQNTLDDFRGGAQQGAGDFLVAKAIGVAKQYAPNVVGPNITLPNLNFPNIEAPSLGLKGTNLPRVSMIMLEEEIIPFESPESIFDYYKPSIKQAERAFRDDPDFQEYLHRRFKPNMPKARGFRTNRNASPEEMREAYEDYLHLVKINLVKGIFYALHLSSLREELRA